MTAQRKATPAKRKTTTTQTARKATPAKKKQTAAQPKTQQRKSAAKAKTTGSKKTTANTIDNVAAKAAREAEQKQEVKDLKGKQKQVREEIRKHQLRLQNNERDVKKHLQAIMIIDNEIADKQKTIDTIRHDITSLDGSIAKLDAQLDTLKRQLEQRKQRYMKSMRYMHRNRSIQSHLMFVFSAKNFTEMYRRQRFVREYAAWQRAQGEAVKSKQKEVEKKQEELRQTKLQKDRLLARDVREHQELENKQNEQKQLVTTLQKEQKTIQGIIAQQRKQDAALNAKIDQLIAEEVEKARKRAEEEARQKAAAEAAKRKAEELARKKAAAEAAARENERRIAEAKAREERLKAQARAAARKNAQEKAAAERAARDAEKARKAVEREAAADAKQRQRDITEAKRASTEVYTVSTEDRRISGSFERNRGRLPIPITGPYRIVTRFGSYNPSGTRGVTLDSKGIFIKGQADARVRSIFDGEVSFVAKVADQTIVMIRHGSYISVYCNLSSVSVSQGQKVSTRQAIGSLAEGKVLQFQLRKEKQKLNPEAWLGR